MRPVQRPQPFTEQVRAAGPRQDHSADRSWPQSQTGVPATDCLILSYAPDVDVDTVACCGSQFKRRCILFCFRNINQGVGEQGSVKLVGAEEDRV